MTNLLARLDEVGPDAERSLDNDAPLSVEVVQALVKVARAAQRSKDALFNLLHVADYPQCVIGSATRAYREAGAVLSDLNAILARKGVGE